MPILRSIISWLIIKRLTQIDLIRKYPIEIQNETLFRLINTAKNTEWGKKYDYNSINSYEEFTKRIPLQDYENIKPYIIRLRQGEQNLLWPSEIKWFAKSSGTTNDKSKFIPVSREAIEDCHFIGGKDIYAIYISQLPESMILRGKALALGGSHQINNFNNESYYGDISAVMIKNLPFWADFKRTPNSDIALIPEWEEKIDKMAKSTISQNVTNIAGVPSWTLVLANYIIQITGKKNLLEIWPNLELFVHGGVSFKPYREIFKKIIPSEKMKYLETYNASEGFFAIQDDFNSEDMLLMLDYGIFYEFIPANKVEDENPPVLQLDDVEINKNYAIVITTNAGLWRYILGDTIKFTSRNPFKIIITGRIKHFINAFGEELIIDNAEKALQIACSKTGVNIKEYTAAPVFMDENQKGAHQWLFEFEKNPDNIDYFMELLDNALKSLNSDYEAKRYKNLTLTFPKVQIAKNGLFYHWLKLKGKLGGQHKIPRLVNNREYIDELLKLNEAI
ncbi:MAG: GH3 auxin-responsive promoter family protein [Bacteroidota bacterium]